MTTVLLAFVFALLVALVATRIVMAVAWRFEIVDRPDGLRKTHLTATPRLGGVAVFLAFVTPLAVLLLFPDMSTVAKEVYYRRTQILGLLVGATLALVLGVIDDIFNLRPRWKFLWQVVVASVVFYFGFRTHEISNPLGGTFELGVLAFPVTLFWFVGCMNAVNLLDGLDGLAAGTCLFVGMTLFLVGLHFTNVLGMLLMACLVGAILGFLIFNFPPARIFLGDSGSMLLGFLVAALSLLGTQRKAQAAVALFVPVIALGVPILDTAVAIVRRWYKRLPITAPDRQHIHHMLVSMGYSQQRAVLILYAICVVLGGAALVITFVRSEVILVVVGSLVVTAFVCMRIFSGVRLVDVAGKLSRDSARRAYSSEGRIVVEQAMGELRKVTDMGGMWKACSRAFEGLGLHSARLSIHGAARGALAAQAWETGGAGAAGPAGRDADRWTARLSVYAGGRPFAELVVEKHITDSLAGAEMPELLDRLRNEIGSSLARMDASDPSPVPVACPPAADAGKGT